MSWIEFEGYLLNIDNYNKLSPIITEEENYFYLESDSNCLFRFNYKTKKQAEDKRAELIRLIKQSERTK